MTYYYFLGNTLKALLFLSFKKILPILPLLPPKYTGQKTAILHLPDM